MMLDGRRNEYRPLSVDAHGRDYGDRGTRRMRPDPAIRRVIAEKGPVTMDLHSVIRAYRRYAGVYDLVFGPAFQIGRMRSVARINALDCQRVLEVGVGTGLSLPKYRRDKDVVGIDVSPEMLAIAQRRARRLKNVTGLVEMDAQRLGFDSDRFDAVVAMHVMSVVPDPQACLAEMQRVCRPGGTILICNHFAGKGDKWITRRIQPLAKWLGWHPDFSLSQLLENSSLKIVSHYAMPPFGMFKLIELTNP